MKCNSYTKTSSNSSGTTYTGTAHGAAYERIGASKTKGDGGLEDCYSGSNHSTSYGFTAGTERYMKNYINETGHAYANIFCTSRYVLNTTFTGVWSPDSI